MLDTILEFCQAREHGWEFRWVSVTSYVGETVTFTFRMSSVPASTPPDSFWYLDDIALDNAAAICEAAEMQNC